MDKQAVFDALKAHLAADLEALTLSQRTTVAGAFHEQNKPENDKDTRAIEASYLARGLAERVAAAQEAVTVASVLHLRSFGPGAPIALTALVTVEDDDSGAEAHYFIAPVGGGVRVEVGGAAVRVLTPASPLGQSLLGRIVDDDIAFQSPQGARTLIVTAVR